MNRNRNVIFVNDIKKGCWIENYLVAFIFESHNIIWCAANDSAEFFYSKGYNIFIFCFSENRGNFFE